MTPRRAVPFAALVAVTAALMAPAGAAQPAGDCTEADPCYWVFDLDADGFVRYDDGSPVGVNGTVGQWFIISVLNSDDQAHDLYLEGYDLAITVPDFDAVDTEPLQLALAGDFAFSDTTTGDWLPVSVSPTADEGTTQGDGDGADTADEGTGNGDAAASSGDTDTGRGGDAADTKDTPNPAIYLTALALAAVAAVARRRA